VGTVELLREAKVADRLDREGFVHDGVGLSLSGRELRIDFRRLTGKAVMIYGQTEVTKDLYGALDSAGVEVVDWAADVMPHDVTSDQPYVTYVKDGVAHRID
jgi:p-hydroxybenzoate 3-monooxygenase